jgi:hypothetical protein
MTVFGTLFFTITKKCHFNARKLTTLHTNTSVFDIPTNFNSILGRRTIILSEDDEISREEARKLWFGFQKARRDSVNYSMRVLFPSTREIREAIEFSRRAGVDSILAVGM